MKLTTNNTNQIIKILFFVFGLEYKEIIKSLYHSHPQYPSYASIAYILSRQGVDSCLIETTVEELNEFPTPFVISYDGLFLPINKVEDEEIHILIDNVNIKKESIKILKSRWDNKALIFNTVKSHVANPSLRDTVKFQFNKASIALSAIIAICIVMSYAVSSMTDFTWINWLFTTTCLVGCFICMLFQIHEFNNSNRLVNSLCHSSKNKIRDCNSILDSKDAKFASLFSWSDFGLIFFAYIILLQFILPSISNEISISLSLMASLYIPYSLIYQWEIAKRWCTLCLATQAVLFANLIISFLILLLHNNLYTNIQFTNLAWALVVGVILVVFFTAIKIIAKTIIYWRKASYTCLHLKYDYHIKKYLFESNPRIYTDNITKLVINEECETAITAIFNPLCTPCIRKMRIILDIMKYKYNTKLEIIFLLDPNDTKSKEVTQYIINEYYVNKDFYKFMRIKV